MVAWLLLDSWAAMASPARHLDLVPAPTSDPTELAARLARVELEAAALREEVAALREDLATLAGLDDEEADLEDSRGGVFSHGWLVSGWARAALVPADADPLPAVIVTAPRPTKPAPAENAGTELVAPARLARAAAPKARAAVARSRTRVGEMSPAAEPAPLRYESR